LWLCLAGHAEQPEKLPVQPLPPELFLYAGSRSCIECHGKFYQLWATSRHGLAMQPYTPERFMRDRESDYRPKKCLIRPCKRKTLSPQDQDRVKARLQGLGKR
jgi:hypothetical protein